MWHFEIEEAWRVKRHMRRGVTMRRPSCSRLTIIPVWAPDLSRNISAGPGKSAARADFCVGRRRRSNHVWGDGGMILLFDTVRAVQREKRTG